MSKSKWAANILFLILGIAVYFQIEKSDSNARRHYLSIPMKGVVSKTSLNIQESVTVWIDSKPIFLGTYYVKSSDSITIGDSIWKEAGVDTLYHFKKNELGQYELYGFHTSGAGKWYQVNK